MTEDARKEAFFSLMQRYVELGRLLPDPDEFDRDDATALAECRLVLAEIAETQREIDALCKRPN